MIHKIIYAPTENPTVKEVLQLEPLQYLLIPKSEKRQPYQKRNIKRTSKSVEYAWRFVVYTCISSREYIMCKGLVPTCHVATKEWCHHGAELSELN